LVLAFLTGNLVRLVVSYLIHPYRPRIRPDVGKARDLFGFGKWVLGSGIIMFLLTQGDAALVGKVIGATMLGMYQMAYRISNVPATEISHVIAQVTFPAYAKLQDNLAKLREGYLRVLQVTAFAAIPVAGLITVLAHTITVVFLGEKWLPAAGAMQILAVWGALRAVGSTAGPVFAGVGKPKILTKYQSIQLVILASLIYPMTRSWGIPGTAWSVVLAGLVANTLALTGVVGITRCGARALLRYIVFPAVATGVAMVSVVAWRSLGLIPAASMPGFLISCLIFGAFYLAFIHLVGSALDYRVTPLVREISGILRARQVTRRDRTWKP
jgi:O-antigen/teichoic acid export membrane protein